MGRYNDGGRGTPYAGRGRGRGGRSRGSGRGRGSQSSYGNNNNDTFRNAMFADFEVVVEKHINTIKKNYKDGALWAKALEEEQEIDITEWEREMVKQTIPYPKVPKKEGGTTDTTDEDALLKYEAEKDMVKVRNKITCDNHQARIKNYHENKVKIYAYLWLQCNNGLQNRIKSREDADKIKNDPIELIKVIKQYAMNFQEHKYEIAAVFEAMNNVCSCRQKEDEPLMVYERRMKTHLDLFVSYMGGKLVLDKFKKEASSKDEDF